MTDERLADAYVKYAPLVYRRSLAILADPDEALDAVQDVFLRLNDRMESFRGESTLVTWLYRVATNHCLNRLRARKTRWKAAQTLRQESEASGQDPLDRRIERRDLLARLLEQFDTRKVQMVFYRYFDEMTQVEIARVMGISERAVRKALRKVIDEAARQAASWEQTLCEKP